MIKALFHRIFSLPPRYMGAAIAGLSALSLAGAFTAQYGFDLHPCHLCLLQRIPFAVCIALGLLILVWKSYRLPLIALAGLSFLTNAGIAFYHSGVERKWWEGLSGCSTPDMSGSIEDLIKRIQETNVARCDEIPWSLFGLSMANYNVLLCLGLGVLCVGYTLLNLKPHGKGQEDKTPHIKQEK